MTILYGGTYPVNISTTIRSLKVVYNKILTEFIVLITDILHMKIIYLLDKMDWDFHPV